MRDKEQQECLAGRWFYEIADLTGMRRAEGEHVKAFASRTHDRARPAYGRVLIDQPRRCVLFATTNDDTYLKSQTGNRRFWPVSTGLIDTFSLRRDRDQLFAEAAHREREGASIVLPREHWGSAKEEQDKRLEADPWDDFLVGVNILGHVCRRTDGNPGLEERISTQHLFQLLFHNTGAKDATSQQYKRLSKCMERLGWEGPKVFKLNDQTMRGYTKPMQE
jgi:Virulence-associated protein E